MAYKIRGIAVYPIKEHNGYTIPCYDKIKIPIDPRKKYELVWNAEIDKDRVDDFSVKGSISKLSEPIDKDRIIQKIKFKKRQKDPQGFYRQWKEWENDFPEIWKIEGNYEVRLELFDERSENTPDKPLAKYTFPVEFTKIE